MSDYIKREDAYRRLTEYYHHTREIQHESLRIALIGIPAEDVAPVRHGHWIYDCCDIVCSECGTRYNDELCYMLRSDCSYHEPRYCLWCGARMDGEDDEID